MKTQIIEATNGPLNWGKFLVGIFDEEFARDSMVDTTNPRSLLESIGWNRQHPDVWVLDLQTCEGAAFKLGGNAHADLEKHRIWVCPLFEPFLAWLLAMPEALVRTGNLPALVDLPDAEFHMHGHRRPGMVTKACGAHVITNDRAKVIEATCSLPAGHNLPHRSADGVTWSGQ